MSSRKDSRLRKSRIVSSKTTKRRGRKPVHVSIAESKTFALYREGRRLLARSDFEQVSISKLSLGAGCSVGAFYVRFKTKNAFLQFVIFETFVLARSAAQQTLSSFSLSSPEITDFVLHQFSDPEFAGVVRMAVKLGFINPLYREPFDDYRAHLVELVSSANSAEEDRKHLGRKAAAVHAALGLLSDTIVSPSAALRIDSSEIRHVVLGLMELKFPSNKRESKQAISKAASTTVEPIDRRAAPRSSRDPSSLRKPISDKKGEPDSSSNLKKI